MRVLVVGANGLLGSNVTDVALDRADRVVTTYHSSDPGFDCPSHRLDITSSVDVDSVISDISPDTVINCAAMTDVDGCENDPERAHAVNATGAENLARAAEQVDAELVHTSTDYVFDGTQRSPYPENADPNPCQEYGRTKLAGEQFVRDGHSDPMILRLSFVYGRSRPDGTLSGFPSWVRDQAVSGAEIPLFTDQYISPSHAESTATTIFDLLERGHSGIFNVASGSCVTPFQFGEIFLKEAGFEDATVVKGSITDVNRDAERPRYTCLDVSRLEDALGRPQSTIQDEIKSFF